ncbi:hypothetical protein NAP1_05730 [Erythrobacter sp. NAP1]|uniref:preprotein translocase subunit SecG n=1 Tax=Erythrobacter sp. NAP1 TaxID=237727 RepID=UPI0000686BA2|nr:preprotein translocase subunit SecG [Erythrobacter sp. NAP1]EAQ30252.1 hypothetical protein NAP1_05730 [Erythrobacter sp. NAP1]
MSLFIIFTVIQAIVAAALVGVVLMQRSEGGGLGIGGNPSGALGARGAADFLTKSTRWLAIAFVALSIFLAALAVSESSMGDVSTDLERDVNAPSAADLLGEGAPAGVSPDGAASDPADLEDLLGENPANTEPANDDPLAE